MKAQQRRRPAGLCVPGRQRGPEQGRMMEGERPTLTYGSNGFVVAGRVSRWLGFFLRDRWRPRRSKGRLCHIGKGKSRFQNGPFRVAVSES